MNGVTWRCPSELSLPSQAGGYHARRRGKPYQCRRPSDREIGRLFLRPRVVTGLAAVCGWVSSGLAVRDFDTRAAYRDWAQRNPRVASRCPTVATPRGAHVFCRLPRSAFVRWNDGELRASCRQFVVLPPSKDRFDRPDRHWIGGDPAPSDFPFLDLGQTGFIDPAHPLDGHRKTKPAKPITSNPPPNDTQATIRVTQVVLD